MSKSPVVLVLVTLGVAVAAQAGAQPVTLLPSSLVRVRADNHFGVTKDNVTNPPVFAPGTFVNSIIDTEVGTAATASNSATYEFSLTGATAVFDIQTTQSYTVGATGNLTEGFIQFTLTEPLVYELSGSLTGASPNDREAFQQRTFLREFQSTFATVFLEDETQVANLAALHVNEGNDAVGGTPFSTFNQSGPRRGVLPPGTYEFAYELESYDRDVDLATAATATGHVRLVLRKPLPPTDLQAVTTGQSVALSWTASPDAGVYVLQAGSAPGTGNVFEGVIGAGTALQSPVPPGTYYLRLGTINGAANGGPSPSYTFSIAPLACTAAPAPPAGHAATTGGSTVHLSWESSPGATSYVLEAGTASGAADLANFDVGGRTTLTAAVPSLTYFTRVRAVNACGTSAPSSEATFTTCVAPAAPTLSFTRPAGAIRLAWTPSLGAVAYVLQVGTAAGASDIFNGSFGAATTLTIPGTILPARVYFIRVLAVGPCGASVASADVAVNFP